MKDWKTTSAGISMIVTALTGVYFSTTIDSVVIASAVTAILGGIGLLFSKDSSL
jgi:hypothetical protein